MRFVAQARFGLLQVPRPVHLLAGTGERGAQGLGSVRVRRQNEDAHATKSDNGRRHRRGKRLEPGPGALLYGAG